jgi:pentalenolactone synthase
MPASRFDQSLSAKRMAMLHTHVADLVEQILGGLPAPPVDLHAKLSTPLPVMVICELLGAPYADHTRLRDTPAPTGAARADARRQCLRVRRPAAPNR